MTKPLIIILVLFIANFLYAQSTYKYTIPLELEDGWRVDNLNAQVVDMSRINQLFKQLKENKHKIHSILLVKDQKILLEEYFGTYQANKQHDLRSVSKSIRSILMGIALDKGYIKNIEEPITKYLKNKVARKNICKEKETITIRHLMTMSTGLDCNDWDKKSKGQEDKVYKKRDWIQYTLDLPMKNKPGEDSYYCSMGVVLMTEIISQASGMTIDEFAKKYLFDPLGISNVSWGHTSEKKVIPSAKRLNMIPRDMAKIGQLLLNKGKWKDQQIVSEQWIEQATSPKTKITGIDYGFLWWNIPFRTAQKNYASIVATGNGGQYIIILPEQNMIAIFTGGAYNSQEDKLPFSILTDVLLPTFETKKD